ncbi:GntR family transcriptional regulator [Mumia sp. ZJ430]|uniref:GntR family transcriptional regulator n=1 Tax=Mumia sp. ZJ430 TaxID=2708083 RepID=UPI001AB03D2C|nr:GntR family transcriptional regulator [Mumia sp. ZJ430]
MPSLTDSVVAHVRDGIRHQQYVPGEIYSVYQLADALGVSRSPVREAMVRLSEAGLIEIARNRGFRVVLPQARDVAEIFAVRLALEPAAARRCGERGVDLSGPYAALVEAEQRGDEPAFWEADQALHEAVLHGSGNARAAAIVASLRATTALLGPPTSHAGRSLHEIRIEHAPIVEALARHDGPAAEAAMRTHLVRTGRLLVGQLAGATPDAAAVDELWDDVVGHSL